MSENHVKSAKTLDEISFITYQFDDKDYFIRIGVSPEPGIHTFYVTDGEYYTGGHVSEEFMTQIKSCFDWICDALIKWRERNVPPEKQAE